MYFPRVANSPTCFSTPYVPSLGSLCSCYQNAFEWFLLKWVYAFTIHSPIVHWTIRNRYDNNHRGCVMVALWCAETCRRIRII